MRSGAFLGRLIAIALLFLAWDSVSPQAAQASSRDYQKDVAAVAKASDISKKKMLSIGRGVCREAAKTPWAFWPSPSWKSDWVEFELVDLFFKYGWNDRTARRVIAAATRDLCPHVRQDLAIPDASWTSVTPLPNIADPDSPPTLMFSATKTEGEVLPLGNAWEFGGRLSLSLSSGKWYEGACATITFLDVNLLPVASNSMRLNKFGDVIEIGPPGSDGINTRTDFIACSSERYNATGAGGGSVTLARWAGAAFVEVSKLTNTGSDSLYLNMSAEAFRFTPSAS